MPHIHQDGKCAFVHIHTADRVVGSHNILFGRSHGPGAEVDDLFPEIGDPIPSYPAPHYQQRLAPSGKCRLLKEDGILCGLDELVVGEDWLNSLQVAPNGVGESWYRQPWN